MSSKNGKEASSTVPQHQQYGCLHKTQTGTTLISTQTRKGEISRSLPLELQTAQDCWEWENLTPPPNTIRVSNTNCLSARKSYAPSNTKQTGQVVVYSVHMCNNSQKKALDFKGTDGENGRRWGKEHLDGEREWGMI